MAVNEIDPSESAERSTGSGVVGLGLTVVDFLSVVDEHPQVDTKQDVSESTIQVGGPVPTALAQLTKLGRPCRLISRWGDDVLGQIIQADLQKTGIAFALSCSRSGTSSGQCQVWIERATGRRTSVTKPPAGDQVRLNDANRQSLREAAALHLDGRFPEAALESAEIVKSSGGCVMLDTGSPKPGIEALLPLADVVNAPRRFIEEYLDVRDLPVGARALLKKGAKVVTVTDGEAGAVMVTQQGVLQVAALDLPAVVDTNGAGDVFSAGLLHGILEKWPAALTLRFAAAAAGLKCSALGNRDALREEPAIRSAAQRLVAVETSC